MSRQYGLIERLSYDSSTGCWNFTGYRNPKGYGEKGYRGKRILVHRLAAHLWLGMAVEDKRQVMHQCDNPSCFNPKHLKLGTNLENQQDSARKGRCWQSKKTHCPKGHPYSEENTYRVHLNTGKTERHCKICFREHSRNYKKGRVAILDSHLRVTDK